MLPLPRPPGTNRRELGHSSQPLTVFPAWTDASFISREGHIPSIVWGPGGLEYAHSPEESILLAEVYQAVRLYALTAWHFTRPE